MPDSTVNYSNILFSSTKSTPHRVPIGPERPTVLQVIVALGRSQIDPISTPIPNPISERVGMEDAGRRKQSEGKMSGGKNEKKR